MPTPPSQPPRGRPGSGPGDGRRACPRIPGPPLPDPDAVRLCPDPRLCPALRRRAVTARRRASRPDQPGRRGRPRRRPGGGRTRPGAGSRPASGTSPAITRPRCHPRPASARRWQLARPVRASARRDAGRIPATPADDDLDHRADPGPDSAAGPDARGWPATPATPGGGVPARVRGDRDDRGGQLRVPGPGPGRPAGAHPAAPRPARSPAPQTPLAVHRRGSRLGGAGTGGAAGWPAHGRAGQPLSPRRGCAGRRGSACTCGLTRRGTGRCGRPG